MYIYIYIPWYHMFLGDAGCYKIPLGNLTWLDIFPILIILPAEKKRNGPGIFQGQAASCGWTQLCGWEVNIFCSLTWVGLPWFTALLLKITLTLIVFQYFSIRDLCGKKIWDFNAKFWTLDPTLSIGHGWHMWLTTHYHGLAPCFLKAPWKEGLI